jgi:type IV pilus assembly protein PilV
MRRMNRGRGFTLIESLVALLVLTVGLLGAAAMLLESLRGHGIALRQAAATNLVRDMAERIRANPRGRAHYDSRSAVAPPACGAGAACNPGQLAAFDVAHFVTSSRGQFPGAQTEAHVMFEPAIGAATPERYAISLRFADPRAARDEWNEVSSVVFAPAPVAGGA